MAGIVFDKILSWLESRFTSLLTEDEICNLRQNLFSFEFDSEMLEMADDDDFRQVIPQEFSLEKKMLLLKASKNIRGRKVMQK